jgi:DNA helicase-2/ATP-dependent DNA helicase PcrA
MNIELKFVKKKHNKPTSTYKGKTVLVDKNYKSINNICDEDVWECGIHFEHENFIVITPIKNISNGGFDMLDNDSSKEEINDSSDSGGFEPSESQKKVYDFIKFGTGNALINAVAGSGKTTTLLGALKIIDQNKNVLFLAYNKSIVEELVKRIPSSVTNTTIKTLHSFGAGILMKKFKCVINGSKYADIAKKLSDGWDDVKAEDLAEYVSTVVKICDLGRLNLKRNHIEYEEIADKHDINLVGLECKRAIEVVRIGMADTTQIDFTDMIFLPNVLKNIKITSYDIVFIDEAQDLNACQRELMLKSLKKDVGRFIAVGDKSQSIYGFGGADIDSFNAIKNQPNTVQLPLSVCYRCASNIVNKAKKYVPQIECRDGAPKGEVDYSASVEDIKYGDMVICRNTYPLVSLCIFFLARGMKCHVKGRDIGGTLSNMLLGTRSKHFSDAYTKLKKELDKLCKNIMTKKKISKAEAINTSAYKSYEEKIDVLKILANGELYCSNIAKKIESIFSDNKDVEGITLSTIHKSKGLESRRVFIIHQEMMPSPYCKDNEWMMEQEMNLIYVAITRAEEYLGYVIDYNAYKGGKVEV